MDNKNPAKWDIFGDTSGAWEPYSIHIYLDNDVKTAVLSSHVASEAIEKMIEKATKSDT